MDNELSRLRGSAFGRMPINQVRSLMGANVNSAAAEKAAQKKKGNPGFKVAKLLPKAGEKTLPTSPSVKIIPMAVPKSLCPTPSVSNSIVMLTAMKPSIKIPDRIIKIQTKAPSTSGNKLKQSRVTTRAGNSIAFLEPILSDNEDNGTTQMVLTP